MEEYRKLDAASLRSLYEQHQRDLIQSLLEGADWTDVQEKRRTVTELSILLYHRTTSSSPDQYNFC